MELIAVFDKTRTSCARVSGVAINVTPKHANSEDRSIPFPLLADIYLAQYVKATIGPIEDRSGKEASLEPVALRSEVVS